MKVSVSSCGHLLLGVWGVIFDRRKDMGVCVCIRTHTHTAQMRYSDVSPGVSMRHLEGPKNLDGLNLGTCIFVYVYKVP